MNRAINTIVIHCSDTYTKMDIGVKEIDEWHRARGWQGCGYHYVIRRSGLIESGRPVSDVGAHVKGQNSNSIGICWVGGKGTDNKQEDNRTIKQRLALRNLVTTLKTFYPDADIVGHRDLDIGKNCPCFNVQAEFK